jgi:hypothetical protein
MLSAHIQLHRRPDQAEWSSQDPPVEPVRLLRPEQQRN